MPEEGDEDSKTLLDIGEEGGEAGGMFQRKGRKRRRRGKLLCQKRRKPYQIYL